MKKRQLKIHFRREQMHQSACGLWGVWYMSNPDPKKTTCKNCLKTFHYYQAIKEVMEDG